MAIIQLHPSHDSPGPRNGDTIRYEEHGLSKVPEITLTFWVIKILATTLGETGGDAVSMSMNLGYVTASLIFLCLLLPLSHRRSPRNRFVPSYIGR